MNILEQYDGENFSLSHTEDETHVDSHFHLHVHDNYELFCLVRGRVGYFVEGHIYNLQPGAMLLMRGAETHKLIVNESETYERYVLNFTPDFILGSGFPESFLAPYTNRKLGKRNMYLPSEFDKISPIAYFEKMFTEAKYTDPKNAILSNLLCLLSATNAVFSTNPDSPFSKVSNNTARKIINHVNENLTKDICLSDISKKFHMSTSQINRIFKKSSGTSLYDYVLSKRLVFAQQCIANGDNAQEACHKSGFHDYSSFYRLFKKRTGSSPTKIIKTK